MTRPFIVILCVLFFGVSIFGNVILSWLFLDMKRDLASAKEECLRYDREIDDYRKQAETEAEKILGDAPQELARIRQEIEELTSRDEWELAVELQNYPRYRPGKNHVNLQYVESFTTDSNDRRTNVNVALVNTKSIYIKPDFKIIFLNKYGCETGRVEFDWIFDTVDSGERRTDSDTCSFKYGEPKYYEVTFGNAKPSYVAVQARIHKPAKTLPVKSKPVKKVVPQLAAGISENITLEQREEAHVPLYETTEEFELGTFGYEIHKSSRLSSIGLERAQDFDVPDPVFLCVVFTVGNFSEETARIPTLCVVDEEGAEYKEISNIKIADKIRPIEFLEAFDHKTGVKVYCVPQDGEYFFKVSDGVINGNRALVNLVSKSDIEIEEYLAPSARVFRMLDSPTGESQSSKGI